MVIHKFVGINGRENFNKLWAELSMTLNSMGFGMKESKKWQELFGKWKSKVKVKAQNLMCNAQKTGAGGPELPELTSVEERLMALIGWKIVKGDMEKEMGVENVFDAGENQAGNTGPSPASFNISLMFDNSNVLISQLPGTSSSSCSNSLHDTKMEGVFFMDVPPLLPIKRKPLESAPITVEVAENKASLETPATPVTSANKKVKLTPTPSKKTNADANHLPDMHSENMSVLQEINTNLARLADSHEAQTKFFSELLDVIKTKL